MTFDKDKYWANRNHTVKQKDEDGKEIEVKKPLRGQGVETSAPAKGSTEIPADANIVFTNDGRMVINNRSYRRTRLSLYPKSSQLRKKNKRKNK